MVSPAGPLELESGETVLRLAAWVIQKSGACVAFLLSPIKGETWTMNRTPDTITLETVPVRPGTRDRVMVSKKTDGKTIAFHWT
ncbi:hypothetical protein [Sinorhizobium sp. BJ1]|uniref:hypothetical protein n=1 Tax=Sinorhizobium sp. BJ1 TaxID=2035455 RepID=UPI000BE8E4F2|nr:hypothetical protein [Sinorhizobium sp. BJ1]PDT81746.1 hypothetical protein CO676_20965 [Sinorhizobium sp. BJ1]